jgi:hypothetical protein
MDYTETLLISLQMRILSSEIADFFSSIITAFLANCRVTAIAFY